MKRLTLALIFVLALTAALFPALSFGAVADAATEVLVVYNWEDYISLRGEDDPDDLEERDLVAGFQRYYKAVTGNSIEVRYTTFDTNETMMETLRGTIDLICPSEYAIQRLKSQDKLMSLTEAQQRSGYTLQNKGNINPVIYDRVEKAGMAIGDYFVPYMWGTLGIMYNADVVTEADLEAGYGILWNAAGNPQLNKNIFLKDSIRDTYVATVLYLKEQNRLEGTPYEDYTVQELINCTDATMLSLAENALIEQKAVNKGYGVDNDKEELMKGTAYVDLAWSGDAVYSIDEAEKGVNLDYFVPEVGGNIWFDGWAIPKDNARNLKAALMFIDYLCLPASAVKNMDFIGYTSAVDASAILADEEAVQLLTDFEYDVDEFFADPVRYPDTSSENLGVMQDFGARNSAANAMWENVKAYGGTPWVLWVVVGVIAVVGLGLGVAFYFAGHYVPRLRKIKS